MNARVAVAAITAHALIDAAFRVTLEGKPRLLPIEQAILDSRPDCNEAMELLDAITAALKLRYRGIGMDEVLQAAERLRSTLHTADNALSGL